MLDRVKASAWYVWRHRTKTLGGIGIVAGYIENRLDAYAHLPAFIETHRGFVLGVFGGLVTLVGCYNTLASFYGWRDEP